MTKESTQKIYQAVTDNPADILKLDLQGLAKLYEYIDDEIDDMQNTLSVVKDSIFELMKTDSERVGNYVATKAKKINFKDLTIERARELGLTKTSETIDTPLAKKAWKNGADLGEVEFQELHVMRRQKEEVASQDG